MLSFHDLHPYQKKAIEFILQNRQAGLWIGLGLGKTIISLSAIEILIRKKKSRKVLIIAPLQVCKSVWEQEAQKWDHTKNLVFVQLTGSEKKRIKALEESGDVYLINRENISWLVDHFLETKREWEYDTVVIDESSSFKSSKTKRFRSLKKVMKTRPRVIQLTGTPSPNGLQDLWSQVFLLDAGERLGKSFFWFLNRYFYSDTYGYKWYPREGSEEQIYRKLKDVILTLKTEDYLSLPEKIEITKVCELPNPILKKYKEIEKNLIAEFQGREIEAINAAALGNKLLQLSNGAIYDENHNYIETHQEKLKVLQDLLDDNPTENFLVGYNFKSDLIRLKKFFPFAKTIKDHPNAIEDWNKGKIKMLLTHPASSGHGLNLQKGGSILVWFGLNWSLELTEQLNGRLFRQGQTKTVKIIKLVSKGCIDERIIDAIEKKGQTQEALLDSLKLVKS